MFVGPYAHWCEVQDMDRSIVFYRDVLKLRPFRLSPYWSEFELGVSKLALHPAMDKIAFTNQRYRGWVLGLQTNNIHALKQHLEQCHVEFAGDLYEVPSGWTLTFFDPDGNPLQAIQLHEELLNPASS
jgi:predicted enzyme related to lactoylglutathione lyase